LHRGGLRLSAARLVCLLLQTIPCVEAGKPHTRNQVAADIEQTAVALQTIALEVNGAVETIAAVSVDSAAGPEERMPRWPPRAAGISIVHAAHVAMQIKVRTHAVVRR